MVRRKQPQPRHLQTDLDLLVQELTSRHSQVDFDASARDTLSRAGLQWVQTVLGDAELVALLQDREVRPSDIKLAARLH